MARGVEGVPRGIQTLARKLKRAQILLLAHEGKLDETICAGLHVGLATAERVRKRFVLKGLEAALNERPRLSTPWHLQPVHVFSTFGRLATYRSNRAAYQTGFRTPDEGSR